MHDPRLPMQGVLPALGARGEFPAAAFPILASKGSFDCVSVHFVNAHSAQDDNSGARQWLPSDSLIAPRLPIPSSTGLGGTVE